MSPLRKLVSAAILVAAILVAVTAFAPADAIAHGYKVGALAVHHPWSRATPKGAKVAGGYLTIENRGRHADRLLGGTTEAGTAIEVHEMSEKDGVMTMRALAGGLEIPAGGSVELSPGGAHLMITGLKRQLVEGEMIKATLMFEKAGPLAVELEVAAMGRPPAHGHDHDDATQ